MGVEDETVGGAGAGEGVGGGEWRAEVEQEDQVGAVHLVVDVV